MKLKTKKAIKKFVKDIDKDIKVSFFTRRLQCDTEKKKIFITLKEQNGIDNETFMELVEEIYPNCPFNVTVLGILHEIGHTQIKTSSLDELRYLQDLQVLENLYINGKIDDREYNQEYVRLDLELRATQWALSYVMLNKKIVENFQKSIDNDIKILYNN